MSADCLEAASSALTWRVLVGDVREQLRTLPAQSVQMCCTSPPYWGLRDYGISGQIGLEPTPDAYVATLVEVFREVRRVLRDDGTCWMNLGDSYAQTTVRHRRDTYESDRWGQQGIWIDDERSTAVAGLKPKDLIGIPWRVAFALQADGWYLRSDIIWAKPNPMPESVTDRPTKAHEYIFLLSKRERYYYNADAIREPHDDHAGEPSRFGNIGKNGGHQGGALKGTDGYARETFRLAPGGRVYHSLGRNARSVWTLPTQAFKGAELLADYVGADGRPYKLSPDCPVHAPRLANGTRQTAGHDARPNHPLTGNADTPSHHVLMRGDECASIPRRDALNATDCDDADGRTAASIHANKTFASDAADTRNRRHSEGRRETAGDNSDSLPLVHASIATPHNTETHKTGHAPATSLACTVFAETAAHTADTLTLRDSVDSVGHTLASKTAGDSVLDGTDSDPSGQISRRNVRNARCNCITVKVDHFATFPEALPERCIKAGSRIGDTVLDPFCGSGTTGQVAIELGRSFIGIELNADYAALARTRIGAAAPLFAAETSVARRESDLQLELF